MSATESNTPRIAPGPTLLGTLRYWPLMLRDPLAGCLALRRDYGDAVRMPLTPKHTFVLLSRPEHAEHILVRHQDRYPKAFTYQPLRTILGDGLVTSEGSKWERHRRLVQPTFSHRHIQEFAPAIVKATHRRVASWSADDVVDIAGEMRHITMTAIGRILFSMDLTVHADAVAGALSRLQKSSVMAGVFFLGSEKALRAWGPWVVPGFRRSRTTLEQTVGNIIEDRVAAPHAEPSDLLDLLLASGVGEDPLNPQEVYDEVLTLMLAGHETTANTLTWALFLLSRHPAMRRRLVAEVDEVLGDRSPGADDVDSLEWTRAIVSETMRLYPTAWELERDAAVDDVIGDIQIRAGDTIGISPYLLHHHPEFWPNPEGFDPARFLPGASIDRPRYAFMPFGAGKRICVGAGLAQMEATLALATLAQSTQLDLVSGTTVRPQADVTLRPRDPIYAKVIRANRLSPQAA